MFYTPRPHMFSSAASMAAFAMFLGSLANFLPLDVKENINLAIRQFADRFLSSQLTLIIPEFDGLVINEVYEAAEIYLGGKINSTTRRLRLSKPKRDKSLKITMEKDEAIDDFFDGAHFRWRMESRETHRSSARFFRSSQGQSQSEDRYFKLSFHEKEKEKVFGSYLPYVLRRAKSIASEKKTLKLFTVDRLRMYDSLGDAWKSVNLEHPSTFDTLALEPKLKKTILDDLDGFVKRKEFYKRVGKAWKRGYLLYGPPGTGKSSLVAAMANYLHFDIYDLDLTQVRANADLIRLMVATANRSILVIEDIDCTTDFQDNQTFSKRNQKDEDSANMINMMGGLYISDRELSKKQKAQSSVTLSGMLNFVDGLWSTCGDERIIIFTTNHKDKLEPALLRPGRMDMHIHLSYCTPIGFRILAYNYLRIKHHPLFRDIKKLIKKVEVTPAEVAEKLMKNDKTEVVIQELHDFLQIKKNERDEAKEGQEEHEDKHETSSEQEDISDNEDTSDEEDDTEVYEGEKEQIVPAVQLVKPRVVVPGSPGFKSRYGNRERGLEIFLS